MDSVGQCFCRKAAEYWCVDDAHPLSGEHVEDLLGNVGQVKCNTIAFDQTERGEDFYARHDLKKDIAVTKVLFGYRATAAAIFGWVPPIAFKNDGSLVSMSAQQVAIDKVETGVGLTTNKPAVVGGGATVQRIRPGGPLL